ncbi:MAG: RsmE family RNA methyltransferase, partial [Bacteroidota bacterium]|nr:RsmE family RNA methyltransferase [Bacteroidota bacterium]
QSLQVYLPEIDVFNDIKSFIKTVENYPVKITAHLLQSLQNPINKVINKNTESVVVIGPEGDFSKDEIALMNQNNFEMCALGSTRLRTETAGVYVCAVVSGMG